MNKPAIIVVAYNRIMELSRLLDSLACADYAIRDIPLVISIDGCGPDEVIKLAESFVWQYGKKEIIHHQERMGLRSHILSCGELSEYYGSIILLEDDLLMSSSFYNYAVSALDTYENDYRIAGISLYSFRNNEYAESAPFSPLDNGYDAYFMQVPSSWGVCFTKTQWSSFSSFVKKGAKITETDALPDEVKTWKDSSWKKDYCKYIVDNNLFFSVPYLSQATNFGTPGTNIKSNSYVYQAPLTFKSKKYIFPPFNNTGVIYDAYMELMPYCFPSWFQKKYPEIVIDIYGIKQIDIFGKGLWLTSRECKQEIMSFGIDLIPIEHNVIHEISGDFLKICTGNNISFVRPNRFFTELAKVNNQFAVYEGERIVRSSKSYIIGHTILAPYKSIRKSINKFATLINRLAKKK